MQIYRHKGTGREYRILHAGLTESPDGLWTEAVTYAPVEPDVDDPSRNGPFTRTAGRFAMRFELVSE